MKDLVALYWVSNAAAVQSTGGEAPELPGVSPSSVSVAGYLTSETTIPYLYMWINNNTCLINPSWRWNVMCMKHLLIVRTYSAFVTITVTEVVTVHKVPSIWWTSSRFGCRMKTSKVCSAIFYKPSTLKKITVDSHLVFVIFNSFRIFILVFSQPLTMGS